MSNNAAPQYNEVEIKPNLTKIRYLVCVQGSQIPKQ